MYSSTGSIFSEGEVCFLNQTVRLLFAHRVRDTFQLPKRVTSKPPPEFYIKRSIPQDRSRSYSDHLLFSKPNH